MDITIDTEFKNLIPPLTAEERIGLEESLMRDGCRDALVTWNGILLDGHNRYEICKKHNIPFETKEIPLPSRYDAIIWICLNQLGRRNLKPYARGLLVKKAEDTVKEKAKERQRAAANETHKKINKTEYTDIEIPYTKEPETESLLEQNSAQADKKAIQINKNIQRADQTRDIIAKTAGISHDTYDKIKKLDQFASDEIKKQLLAGEISVNRGFQKWKQEERAAEREEKRQENIKKVEKLASPLEAKGLFQTIVIDPPWDHGDMGDNNVMGRANPDYMTMPLSEIMKLPIGKIADENCHLYLWVTNRMLPKVWPLFDAWGFRYVTCLTWVKPSMGLGNYFRGQTEQVLFGVKGHELLKRKDATTYFAAPRGDGGNSSKPDEFYDFVMTCSYGPYIDVFGRKKRENWSLWGENG